MSKKKKHSNNNNNNKVSFSNINIDKILNEILKTSKNDKSNEYEEFCNKYIDENFEHYDVATLNNIYDIGNGLLYQYFVTEDKNCDNEIVKKMQYVINEITYIITTKQFDKLKLQNEELDISLTQTIERAEQLNNNSEKIAQEVIDIKKDMKSITTTIISIILAISIIPTAIAGIEKISANYILPFLSSIILFGIIMITFIYSIYQDKLKKSTWAILILTTILTEILWIVSIINVVNIEKVEKEKSTVNEISDVGD